MTRSTKHEADEAAARLREWVKPGDTLYTILRHRSSSGMSRVIDVKHIRCEDGVAKVRTLGWNIAKALGWSYDDQREGIKVSGAGMDMGFHVVYTLGRVLWPEGVPAEHSERRRWVNGTGTDGHYEVNGDTETDGGYALQQAWL